MFWYEDDVRRLENDRKNLEYEPETLFYGSSSIRLWTTLYEDFADLRPVNLGFGGSTLAACVWFFERVMQPYHPKRLVFYAGDNDLGDGRHPEEIFIFFEQLMVKTAIRFPGLPCYFISLKPSLSRWHMADQFVYTNQLIKDRISETDNWQFIDIFDAMLDNNHPRSGCYVVDGLHMSDEGYRIWKKIVSDHIYAGLHFVHAAS